MVKRTFFKRMVHFLTFLSDFLFFLLILKTTKIRDGILFLFVLIFLFKNCFYNLGMLLLNTLESEEKQEGHHKTEKTHSFRQSETQNGV